VPTETAKPPLPAADSTPPSRAPLYTTLLVRVAEVWRSGSTYVIEIDSVRNANGAAAEIRGPLEVPKPKIDSTATHPDSAAAPPDSVGQPPTPANDSLRPTKPAR
jgi:hypothetical protein